MIGVSNLGFPCRVKADLVLDGNLVPDQEGNLVWPMRQRVWVEVRLLGVRVVVVTVPRSVVLTPACSVVVDQDRV